MSHVTIAASANAFTQLFNALRNNFTFSQSDSANFGPFSASYAVAMHLENGSLSLHDDNTIEVQHLDIVWDTLKVKVCFDLPGFCTPSACLVPDPWNGCLVGLPSICIGGPLCIPLDLSGLVSEVSDLQARLLPVYYVDPARLPAWSDLDAEFAGHPNKWRIFIDPVTVLVDPIDVPASIGNIFENIIKDAITSFLPSWLPDWAKSLLLDALEPVFIAVKALLGLGSSIEDWLSDLIGNKLNLLSIIETAIADYFAAKTPIFEFEDPYPILDGGGGLIPVKLPIRNLSATIDSKEMTVLADVGA